MKRRTEGHFHRGPAVSADTVVVGMADEPDYLIDEIARHPSARVVLDALQAKLVRLTDSWQLQPELADRVPSSIGSDYLRLPDGSLLVIWRLRDGFTWHDGRRFTADDLRWSTLLLKQIKPDGFFPTYLNEVASVFLMEPGVSDNVVVVWRGKPPVLAAEWGSVLPPNILRWNSQLSADDLRNLACARAPVHMGPFQFEAWAPGEQIVLSANPRYPLRAPSLRQLIFRFYQDKAALKDAIVRGDVDVSEMTGFTLADAADIEAAVSGPVVHRTPTATLEQLTYNLAGRFTSNRRVRWAIAHALQRGELQPGTEAAGSWVPVRHPAFRPVLEQYAYDPQRAARLLEEAGLPLGPNGIRVDRTGAPAVLRLAVVKQARPTAQDRWLPGPDYDRLAEAIVAGGRQVGLEVAVEAATPAEAVTALTAGDGPDLLLHGCTVRPELAALHWHSKAVPSPENGGRGLNWAGYRDERNDGCIERAAWAASDDERRALLWEQQESWAYDLPALPLFFRSWITTAKPELAGVRPVGAAESFITWNAVDWFWLETPVAQANRGRVEWPNSGGTL